MSRTASRKRSSDTTWLLFTCLLVSAQAEFDLSYFDTRGWADKMAGLDEKENSEWKFVDETPCFYPKEEPCRSVYKNVAGSKEDNGTIAVQMREPRFSELLVLQERLVDLSQEGFIPEVMVSKTYHHPSELWGIYFLKDFGTTQSLVEYVQGTKNESAIVQLAEEVVYILSRLAEIGIQHHDLSLYDDNNVVRRSEEGNWVVRNGHAFLMNFEWAQDEIDPSTSRIPSFIDRPKECAHGCDDCVASKSFARLFQDSSLPWIAQVFATMEPPFCNAEQQLELRGVFASAKEKNVIKRSEVNEEEPRGSNKDKKVTLKKKKKKKKKAHQVVKVQ